MSNDPPWLGEAEQMLRSYIAAGYQEMTLGEAWPQLRTVIINIAALAARQPRKITQNEVVPTPPSWAEAAARVALRRARERYNNRLSNKSRSDFDREELACEIAAAYESGRRCRRQITNEMVDAAARVAAKFFNWDCLGHSLQNSALFVARSMLEEAEKAHLKCSLISSPSHI